MNPSPTRGQLERTLSQRIESLYRSQLEHKPSKVVCQIFDEKIAIILEDSIINFTRPIYQSLYYSSLVLNI